MDETLLFLSPQFIMDILALQTALILGGTNIIGKFIKDKDARDDILPIIAAILGMVSSCYFGAWDMTHIIQGLIIGGTVTGLYGTAKGIATGANAAVEPQS